ncbi:glycoside hydrolase family 1 protein [candidate division WWE3 bacterium]|nr:glycoside hydrolase family 1 protein [candidate division WWE3 bacterium]
MADLKFPEGFLWGAATSGHQIEGGNVHSDWWVWEQEMAGKPGGPLQKSGIACDSYNRYEEDFRVAKELKHNAHRMSIEWSRIEPREGEFDEKEIAHYRNVLKTIKSNGMSTIVTLWHFTIPQWFRAKGGFGSPQAVFYFTRYTKLIAEQLGANIDFFITLNEPLVYLVLRHIDRRWNPEKSGLFELQFLKGWVGFVRCHRASFKAIKSLNKDFKVGFVENIMDIDPKDNFFLNKIVASVRKFLQYEIFLRLVLSKADFFGVNYYFHALIDAKGLFLHETQLIGDENSEKSDWGWEIHPEGIYDVVVYAKKFKLPILITENGLDDGKDVKREAFIVRHLYFLRKAIDRGGNVIGYLHWSLLDNFEWSEGYLRKFGLVEVVRENNLERKVRKSALTYARICQENALPSDLVEKYVLNSTGRKAPKGSL